LVNILILGLIFATFFREVCAKLQAKISRKRKGGIQGKQKITEEKR